MNPPSQLPENHAEKKRITKTPRDTTSVGPSASLPKMGLPAMSGVKENTKELPCFTPEEGEEDVESEDVLGQFSYAPATQTTVVTTTRTVTTKFPPLVLKAPKHLHELDPKQYPLASSPTPQCIKKINFGVAGRPTTFREADDTLDTLEKVWFPKNSFSTTVLLTYIGYDEAQEPK